MHVHLMAWGLALQHSIFWLVYYAYSAKCSMSMTATNILVLILSNLWALHAMENDHRTLATKRCISFSSTKRCISFSSTNNCSGMSYIIPLCEVFSHVKEDCKIRACTLKPGKFSTCIAIVSPKELFLQKCSLLLPLKVLNFWKFTSYCSLKPLWSGMGEVMPARTSPTLHPPSPPTVHQLSWLAL